jgi:hypothetical protein
MSICLVREHDDYFADVFGERRGSGRTEPADTPLGALPFRTVFYRSRDMCYDPVDALVIVCERCGQGGFLARDWSDPELPALCIDCHTSLATLQAEGGHCCEDWCEADLDHDGLCRPR